MAATDKLMKQAGKSYLSALTANPLNANGDREFLFCIPVQVGPPTPQAKNVLSWMHMILLVQVIVLVLRVLVLWDFKGAFWMAFVLALGFYAIYQDLNITYVCCWGLACAIHGVVELLGLIMPYIIPVFPKLNFIQVIIGATIPLVYLAGALLARHLYHDYAQHQGWPTTMFTSFDPMGHYIDTTDLEEQMPILSHAADKFSEGAQNAAVAGAAKAQQAAVDGAVDAAAAKAQMHAANGASSLDAAKASFLGSLTANGSQAQALATDTSVTSIQPSMDTAKVNAQRGLDSAAQNANIAAKSADVLAQQAAQNAAAHQAQAQAAAQALLAQGNVRAQAASAAAQGAIDTAALPRK